MSKKNKEIAKGRIERAKELLNYEIPKRNLAVYILRDLELVKEKDKDTHDILLAMDEQGDPTTEEVRDVIKDVESLIENAKEEK